MQPLIAVLQSSFQQATDFLLSSTKMMFDSTKKTLYISYKTLRNRTHTDNSLLVLTLFIHEDIAVLTRTCGHGR